YRLNLKSKELKRVSVNFNATSTYYSYASGSSRYLYGYSLDKNGIRVFDCKTNKIIRTLTGGRQPVVDGGKLYYATDSRENNYTRFYRASLSGATRELLFEIPTDNVLVDYLGADVICYQTWEIEGIEEGFHVYTVATGEDKVVDMDHAGEEGYKTMQWGW
ncbi:MAG: YncE family protein, partial [Anaerovoracaceae bacterium]